MHNLSERLSLIAEFVERGSAVCDVGTDHGYLPAFLYLSGRCTSVVATDIRQKPLENARENLERLGAQGVKLFLCDGLEAIDRDMTDTVIIAGMGGEVISGIIDRAPFLRDNTVSLILQPMTAARELREYLSQEGFSVESEKAICENAKIYSVMKARFTGKPYSLSPIRALIGLLRCDSDASRAYINKQYRIALKCAEELKNAVDMRQQYEKFARQASDLKLILEGKNGI